MTSRLGWCRVTTGRQQKQKQKQKQKREPPGAGPGRWLRVAVTVLALAAMVAFGVVLARLTLQPSPASEMLTHANLRPGNSIRAYLGQPAFRDTVKQLGGNVLLGVPFGLLLPVVSPVAAGSYGSPC